MRTEKDDHDLLNLHTVAFKILIPGCVSVYIIHSIYQLNLKDTKHNSIHFKSDIMVFICNKLLCCILQVE